MVKQILLNLICIVLLLSACQSPALTSVSAESATNSLPEIDNNLTPTFTSVPKNTSPIAPNISDEHYRSFYYYAYNSAATIKSWNLIMDTSDPNYPKPQQQYLDLYNLLAESYETARLHYPSLRQDITDVVTKKYKNKMNDPNVQDLITNLNAFFDSVENMSVQEQQQLVNQAVADFGLDKNNSPPVLQPSAFDGNTKYTFNPQDANDVSILHIMMSKAVNQSYFDTIEVTGAVFDSNTFQLQPVAPIQVGSNITYNNHGYLINIPVNGAADWAIVKFKKNGKVVGYYLAANRLLGLPHLMAMRPLSLTQEGRNFMTPPTYGAPDPIKLPVIPQDQLENQMRQNLSNALAKAVAEGDISQDESNSLLGKFDDPQLISVIKDPEIRAAILVAASLKSVGGELLLPKILDPNHPVKMYFENDPALGPIFQAHSTTPIKPLVNKVRSMIFTDDGTQIVIWGSHSQVGQEPIEVMASSVAHEVLVHSDGPDSFPEELVGNLVSTLAWLHLIQRDPTLVTNGTYTTQRNNLTLYALMNTIYVDDTAESPFVSHVGLTSRITGVQTHGDISALPRNGVQSVHSYNQLIRLMYQGIPDIPLSDYTQGSETTLALFKNLFGADLKVPSQYGHHDPNDNSVILPDFSDGLIQDFLDGQVHQAFTDEMVIQTAQILHVTLDGSTARP